MSYDECLSRRTEADDSTAIGGSVADGCGVCSSRGFCWAIMSPAFA